jgi:hypothetical protein
MPPLSWSQEERRRIARVGLVAAACLSCTIAASMALLSVDVFLAFVVFGAGVAIASFAVALALARGLLAPAPPARPTPRLVARHEAARATLRVAEQRVILLARATDRRSRRELDTLRRLIARVCAQQALVLASSGDVRRLRVVVGELRDELASTARTVLVDAPRPRRRLEG